MVLVEAINVPGTQCGLANEHTSVTSIDEAAKLFFLHTMRYWRTHRILGGMWMVLSWIYIFPCNNRTVRSEISEFHFCTCCKIHLWFIKKNVHIHIQFTLGMLCLDITVASTISRFICKLLHYSPWTYYFASTYCLWFLWNYEILCVNYVFLYIFSTDTTQNGGHQLEIGLDSMQVQIPTCLRAELIVFSLQKTHSYCHLYLGFSSRKDSNLCMRREDFNLVDAPRDSLLYS